MSTAPRESGMEADLIRIDPARNTYRFYRLALWPDLFGGIALVREWGRLGSPGRLRPDLHADEQAARRALERLMRAKCRRGYRKAA
jgi:predicted DNA-binding WGR domain protein